MRAVFLGTNGWYNTALANTTCILIRARSQHIILDAGDGLHKIGRFIKDKKPISLFLSHPHLDHISGLHTLNKFSFPQGVKIYGYQGMKRWLCGIMRPPYSLDLLRLPTPVKLIELKEGRYSLGLTHRAPKPRPVTKRLCNGTRHSWRGKEAPSEQPLKQAPLFRAGIIGGLTFEALALVHSTKCFGYRLELEEKIIAYCADTGPCQNALRLSRGADLLIAECSLKSGQANASWPHLNPRMAAEIAREAGAKLLALMHFNPFLFPELKDRQDAAKAARKIFKHTVLAKDGLELGF
jgi:ribonuclease BN (tRNA processing enzyme)